MNRNQLIYTFVILFVLSSKTSILQAQDKAVITENAFKQDTPRSSMWGQIGNQVLPSFNVNKDDFEYPEEAMKNRTQGQVDVMFRVNKDDNIIDSTVQIMNSLSKELDEKAIEMVKKSSVRTNWPFIMGNLNTNIRYVTTLVFTIHEKHWATYYNTIGLRAYRENNYQKAIKNFNLSIQFDDKNAKSHYSLYWVYSKMNKIEKACDCIKNAKRLDKAYRNEWKSKCK